MRRFNRQYDSFALHVMRERAREMRCAPTQSESLLWLALRRKALGIRFRRQVVLGPYIVDFFAPAADLAIEVDGGVHRCQAAADAKRDAWLATSGVRVLHVSADEVFRDLPAVVSRIAEAVRG